MPRFFQNRNVLIAVSICYLSLLIYLLFFAFFREGTTTEVNLIPLGTIAPLTRYTFTSGHGILHWIINVPGNVVLFIPLGFIFLKFRKTQSMHFYSLLLLFSIPFFIELSQYFFKTGACDIDDVILNTIGVFFGLLIIRKRKAKRSTE